MQVLDNVKPLSSKLLDTIPPLKDGEVAIFRLKNAFIKEGGREEYSCPETVQMSGLQTVMDPYVEKGESKTKIIGTYIKDYRQLGSGQARPVYQDLEFRKGELRLTSDRQAEYEFAMRNIHNESNKYRKQMGGKHAPKFFLVGTKEITTFMQMSDMKYHAEKLIRESNFTYLREVATKLNMSVDAKLHVKSFSNGITINAETMKYEMIQLARTYPKQVMAAHPDDKIRLRVQIYDAQVYGVLMFEKGAYQLDTTTDFVELFKPEEDVDKIDSLIDYFMSEKGDKHYQLFAITLRKALNVSKT